MSNEFLLQALSENFKLPCYRKGQLETIQSVLSGKDTLAVMPTGGGKSLCYQIPAVVGQGLVIVVSPLVALMQDQVRFLHEKGIGAGCLYSGQDMAEKEKVFSSIKKGGPFLLYLSPERVQKPGFAKWIKEQKVLLFAIDEAHCISQWGPDFRLDYHKLNILRELRPDVPLLALTASATPAVLKDITARMGLREPARNVYGFYRPNLFCQVEPCVDEEEKFAFLHQALKGFSEGRVLIYCGTRQLTETLSSRLSSDFKGVGYYHAGLEAEERKRIQEKMNKGEIRILAATNAFGMGIDYPDVRLVVHFSLPSSVEAYYQEVGRAGRDGNLAYGLMLYARADRGLHSFFIKQSKAEAGVISQRWRALDAITHFVEGGECRHAGILTYFRDSERIKKCGHCDTCAPEQALKVRVPKTVLRKLGVSKKKEINTELLTPEAEVRAMSLKEWRKRFAEEHDIAAFIVFSNRTLNEIAHKNPRSLSELRRIYGLGENKVGRFGDELLRVLEQGE